MTIGLGLGLSFSRSRLAPKLPDHDATTYINAVETADGEALEGGVKIAIIDFVEGCKADGIWDALKASCILAGARTLDGALVPIAGTAPTNVNFVSADYDRKTGLKGNGSTKYLNSNRAHNADGQSNRHIAINVTQSLSPAMIGSETTGANRSFIYDTITRFNSSGSDGYTAALGFIGLSRAQPSGYIRRVSGANTEISKTSVTLLGGNITVFQDASSAHSSARLSFYSIGESIDLAALDARVSALMTAIDGAIA